MIFLVHKWRIQFLTEIMAENFANFLRTSCNHIYRYWVKPALAKTKYSMLFGRKSRQDWNRRRHRANVIIRPVLKSENMFFQLLLFLKLCKPNRVDDECICVVCLMNRSNEKSTSVMFTNKKSTMPHCRWHHRRCWKHLASCLHNLI